MPFCLRIQCIREWECTSGSRMPQIRWVGGIASRSSTQSASVTFGSAARLYMAMQMSYKKDVNRVSRLI
ncbi:hypothetical protein DIPPA_21036 [Diplonema papillatum]|nr:hypothetical protein DIPPA_21036 [Diplonema papillatum]